MSKEDKQFNVKGNTYHVNTLKRYVERCESMVQCVMSIVNSENINELDVEDGQVEELLEGHSQESCKDVIVNPGLRKEEVQLMMDLL